VFHVPLVPGEEHAFEVCDPVISGDASAVWAGQTAGHGHPRVVLIASNATTNATSAVAPAGTLSPVGVQTDSGDIELWHALGVNRGVLGVSAEVMAQCRGGDQSL
jgi:hypothetical protein